MKYNKMVEMLRSELDDAEASIENIEEDIAAMEEDITNLRMEISFIEGRQCLACGLLCHLNAKQIEEV